MENNSSSAFQGNNDPKTKQFETQKQLNSEELRVLRECNRESFYYRCLPFAMSGMALTYLGFKRGLLTGHPKYGPAIKMTAAAFTGWLIGKISYRSKCEDKFVNVPNSIIGDAIRKKRGLTLETFDREGSIFSSDNDLTSKDSIYTSYSGDYHSSSGSLNFDKNVPFTELDDRDRPSMDNANDSLSDQSQSMRTATTYDELRSRNREEYQKQLRQPGIPKTDSFNRPWSQTNFEPQRRTNIDSREDIPKNVYGDNWDNPKFK